MIAFPDLTNTNYFPYPEGYQFEFKETASKLCTEKLLGTICAFLNNEGGYFIVGICDNKKIVGVKQNKDLDNFLQRVDSIYHDRMIVHDDGAEISFKTIKAWDISLKNGNILSVVQAIPESGKKYRLHTGETYYRLSASNYRLTNINNQITVSQLELEAMIFNKTISIKREYDNYINKTKKEYDTLVNQVSVIEKKYENIKNKLEKEKESTQMLFDLILQQKKEKEKELYGKKEKNEKEFSSLALCNLLI